MQGGLGWGRRLPRFEFHPLPTNPAIALYAPALIDPRANGSQADLFAPGVQGEE